MRQKAVHDEMQSTGRKQGMSRSFSAPKVGAKLPKLAGSADGHALQGLMPDLLAHLTENKGSITEFLDYEAPPPRRPNRQRKPGIWLPETFERSASTFLPPNP